MKINVIDRQGFVVGEVTAEVGLLTYLGPIAKVNRKTYEVNGAKHDALSVEWRDAPESFRMCHPDRERLEAEEERQSPSRQPDIRAALDRFIAWCESAGTSPTDALNEYLQGRTLPLPAATQDAA